MVIKIPGKSIEIRECNTFKSRYKSLKFYLYPLDFCLYFPKRWFLDTYFFCQNVDAIFTDQDDKILYMHENIRSEKRRFHLKAKKLYICPLGTCKYFEIGDTLRIKEK